MSTNILRDYQISGIEQINAAWAGGVQNVLYQLSTGGGKTVIAAEIFNAHRGGAIAIAHRMELVGQLSLTLAKYGIYHDIIAAKQTIRNIISTHMYELKKSYYCPGARKLVAGVDTLIRASDLPIVDLILQDEAHHVLRKNKWGKAAEMFPYAKGLYLTATPCRADGYGLGRHADGVIDTLIPGPDMRSELIAQGYLTDYKIIGAPCQIDLSDVPIAAGGDYSPPKLRDAIQKSHIVGNIVEHYLRFAAGKRGITFTVSIEHAGEIAAAYRDAGVPAEVISGTTPDLLRATLIRKFRDGEILQLVNVDLLGEGVDIPAIEVVSMARPTQSYAVYAQQFGRALRPLPGKTHALIIDHVNNYLQHGLPDRPRVWTLDRRDKRSRTAVAGVIPLRSCPNPRCLAVYERVRALCPHCGFKPVVGQRSAPEHVDGDLIELAPETLAALRGEVERIDGIAHPPGHLDPIAQRAVFNRHRDRQQTQLELRNKIAQWAGYQRAANLIDSEIYKKFYFLYGVDILTAQTLNVSDAEKLINKIDLLS